MEKIKLFSQFKVSGVSDQEQKVNKELVQKGLEFGEVEVVVSNDAIDRHGESISVRGIDTNEVMKNPVLLWGHDYSSVPIGKIKKLWKRAGNLMARVAFDYDIDEFANKIYQKVLRGSINAVSIGGIVDKWSEDFTVIEKMEMVELSFVPVGAHRDALVTAKQLDESLLEFAKAMSGRTNLPQEPNEVNKGKEPTKQKQIIVTI